MLPNSYQDTQFPDPGNMGSYDPAQMDALQREERDRQSELMKTLDAQGNTPAYQPPPPFMFDKHALGWQIPLALILGALDPTHQAGGQFAGGVLQGAQMKSEREAEKRKGAISAAQTRTAAEVEKARLAHDIALRRLLAAMQAHTAQAKLDAEKPKIDAQIASLEAGTKAKELTLPGIAYRNDMLNQRVQYLPRQLAQQYDIGNARLRLTKDQADVAEENLKTAKAIDPSKILKAAQDAKNAVTHGKSEDADLALKNLKIEVEKINARYAGPMLRAKLANLEKEGVRRQQLIDTQGGIGKPMSQTAVETGIRSYETKLNRAQTELDKAKASANYYRNDFQGDATTPKEQGQQLARYFDRQAEAWQAAVDRINKEQSGFQGRIAPVRVTPPSKMGKRTHDGWGEVRIATGKGG